MTRVTNVPIQDSVTERPSSAGATEEQVPDRVRERRCLCIRREASRAGLASETDCDNLALGLARLDGRCEELTVGQLAAGEDGVGSRATDLE